MEDLVSRISTGRCPGMKLGQRFESSPPKSSIPDPLFSRRVASGDISVVHLQDNEEEQKIAKLKLTDAGFYICRTPSTDPIMSGNYDAQVQLRVIPNTLKVSPQAPSPVVQEGDDLKLSCSLS
ncbi:immunoglobulin superfamily member 8-like isoform X2 [Poecilia reticulata]|uniref:immunoglobulin superfamily member 8-like isoform X2 n=1 Tax=Poecilia reticulata TaxID=8081 RepID=UPI0004A429C4|nr:PREDICTED: immunoglobulin superfamily member 8-like isoform X2 [Poecilia reticulata]